MLSEWLGAASSDAVDEIRWVCSPSVPFLPGPSRFIYFSIIQKKGVKRNPSRISLDIIIQKKMVTLQNE